MLLEEVKKLKVSELRAELRDRGLDPKGLKAELVARLLSAIGNSEPEQSPDVTHLDTELVQTAEEISELTCQTESATTTTTFSTAATTSGEQQQTLEQKQLNIERIWRKTCVDQSTQTENDTAVEISQTGCSCSHSREEGDQLKLQCVPSRRDSSDGHQEEIQSVSLLPHMMTPVTAETGTEMLECQDVGGSHGERGRDYYEFKEEIQYMRAKTPEPGPASEDEMDIDDDTVRLDPYNSDLHFEVGADGSSGQPLLWEKFPLLHSGCRLTHGFTHGKVGFEVKYAKRLSADIVTSVNLEHVLRVGWSVDGSSLQLGEEELSYGFDCLGKAVTGGKMEEFGEPFSEGDVIGCYAFIGDGGETELSFSKNGHFLGVAFRFAGSTLAGRALYPHVLCKNCSVSFNLASQCVVWYPSPAGYCCLPEYPPSHRIQAPLPPLHRKDCEVLLMVGMPGSGKSHWAESHMAKNSEKRYNVLSTNTILHCMRLPNPEQKNLMLQQATQCVTHLIKIAATKRRNFILDQANIYPSAQRHKLLSFAGYQRKAVVLVPSDEEWKRRLQKKEQSEGAVLLEISLLKSKASFTLPEKGDLLEDVLFAELCREDAEKLLTSYKEEAARLLPTPPKRKTHKKRPHKRHIQAHGMTQTRSQYAPQSQWGGHKQNGWNFSAFSQPYGCNSDPQRYRDYYQPCTEQWNLSNQSQSYYGSQSYYFGNQAFW